MTRRRCILLGLALALILTPTAAVIWDTQRAKGLR